MDFAWNSKVSETLFILLFVDSSQPLATPLLSHAHLEPASSLTPMANRSAGNQEKRKGFDFLVDTEDLEGPSKRSVQDERTSVGIPSTSPISIGLAHANTRFQTPMRAIKGLEATISERKCVVAKVELC